MKFNKGIIPSLFLLCIIFILATIPVSAATTRYDAYADKLSVIGVFVGTGNGFDLDREPTRLEGLIMLIRLLGAEEEAKSLTGSKIPFDDVPSWGSGYVAYAYNKGLTKGLSPTTFGTYDLMTSNSFMTFVLRALSFDDSQGDFTWAGANEYAKSIGLLDENTYFDLNSRKFLRDHVAKVAYDALLTQVKRQNTLLLDKLISQGAIDPSQAITLIEGKPNQSTTSDWNFDMDAAMDACVLIEVVGQDGEEWTGSGVFLDNQGTLVTNYHVIDMAKTVTVTDNNGNKYRSSTVIGYNASDDLALIKISRSGNAYLKVSTSQAKVGDRIFAIGSPYGLQNTLSEGIISGLRTNNLQISAPISHGSSGGALINTNGELIGITYSGIVEGENLGFAIPVNRLQYLPKNLSLSYDAFYIKEYAISAPTLTTWVEDDMVQLQWTDVGAPYYHLYKSRNGGPYKLVYTKYGDAYFEYSNEGPSFSDVILPSDIYVTYKVVPVYNNVEGPASNITSLNYTVNPIDVPLDIAVIIDVYSVITLHGGQVESKRISFELLENSDTIVVYFYLDKENMLTFAENVIEDPDQTGFDLFAVADDISNFLDKSIILTMIYTDSFRDYQPDFAGNAIISGTIMPNKYGQWFVYYPLVKLEDMQGDENFYYEYWK